MQPIYHFTMSKKTTEPSVIPADVPTIPVISNVRSLATNGPPRLHHGCYSNTSSRIDRTQINQNVFFKPPPFPSQRNVATMCKIVTSDKGTSHTPTVVDKEIQTDEVKAKTALIPVPVPMFVPSPLCMYSLPFPVPVPFPLPVPVPIFIPTGCNSTNGIMKKIKKIQAKIPIDPLEAELVLMADIVAGDEKEDDTDSNSDEEEDETTYSPEPVGDDMHHTATELNEPAVDLEGALKASTVTTSSQRRKAEDDPQPTRGRKRPGPPPKRSRRASKQMDIPTMAPPQPPPPPEPVEKPDADMCLKFTFGVKAWKQWVTTKNAELEKSSHRMKLFKPEILQLTAYELNYSLCSFVKEVRKPNGEKYAPDTIYYLCLGIQMYLFENGRIDNIFWDPSYEKFTDCLDDLAKKFSVLYDSHYIVTRIEEEHLWESKQLGAHSPHVLLNTLMFFNTKHFNLRTADEHMQLSFSQIVKHWKRNPNTPGTNKARCVLLGFYPLQTAADSTTPKKKVYKQRENEENPLRCPIKFYEFYLSKCPVSVQTRTDAYYLLPERSCTPDSPIWYSTMPLPRNALEKMTHRLRMVKEINVALLGSSVLP